MMVYVNTVLLIDTPQVQFEFSEMKKKNSRQQKQRKKGHKECFKSKMLLTNNKIYNNKLLYI